MQLAYEGSYSKLLENTPEGDLKAFGHCKVRYGDRPIDLIKGLFRSVGQYPIHNNLSNLMCTRGFGNQCETFLKLVKGPNTENSVLLSVN